MISQKPISTILFILLLSVLSDAIALNGSEHKCVSCATLKFVRKRWLMQDFDAGQVMGWSDWRGTDCDSGVAYVVPCNGSCLTITVEKQLGVNEYLYAGTMEECSDDFIRASPDLPQDMNFRKFFEEAVYVSKRKGHRITYSFHRESFIDKHDADVRKLKDIEDTKKAEAAVRARLEAEKNPFGFGDGVVVFALAASVLIIVCVIVLYFRVCSITVNKKRNDSNNGNTQMELGQMDGPIVDHPGQEFFDDSEEEEQSTEERSEETEMNPIEDKQVEADQTSTEKSQV